MKSSTLYFLFFIIFQSALHAQKGPLLGIQAGINRATATNDNRSIVRFSGGLFTMIPITTKLNFQTGAFYEGKGSANTDDDYRSKNRTNHLQVPFYLNYRVRFKPGQFYVGAGPYAAAALSGKFEYEMRVFYNGGGSIVNLNDDTYRWLKNSARVIIGKDIQKQNDPDYYMRRMDYGLTGHAGFIINNGFFINAGYDMGLANISYSRTARRLQTANVSVGYIFK